MPGKHGFLSRVIHCCTDTQTLSHKRLFLGVSGWQLLFACLKGCLHTACASLVLAEDFKGCLYMQGKLASDGSWLLEPVQICQTDSETRCRRELQINYGSAEILPRQTLPVIHIVLLC
jgi:hypothetical protein